MKSFVLAALLVSTTAAAETAPPTDITADQAVDLYRAHNARLAASRADVDVARADIAEARIYPNPEVGLSTSRTTIGDTAGPTQQYQLDVSIPILIGHQRKHREEAANAHVTQATADVAAGQADAELEIHRIFDGLLAAQEKTKLLDAALADTKKVREIVAGRTSAGAGSNYAVERIDLAIAALASRVDEARADELTASSALAIGVGIPGWQPHASGALITEAAAPTPLTAPDGSHPMLAAIRARFATARADEARAHADAVPTPSLGLQTFTTNGPSGLAVGGGFSIPLPLFDKNQGAIARARAEAHRADLELAATTVELSGELARATRDLTARRDALAHFQADALQRLNKVRDMAENSYRSGQGGIVELLDALDAITDARLRELELRQAVAEADLAVRRASRGR